MIKKFDEFIEEGALPSENSVKQLNKVKRLITKTDIGSKVAIQAGNSITDRSALDNVESYEDFMKGNKNFNPNWNNTGQEPYKKKKK